MENVDVFIDVHRVDIDLIVILCCLDCLFFFIGGKADAQNI